MKSSIVLDSLQREGSYKEDGAYFDGTFNIKKLLSTPLSKVHSVMVVCGNVNASALSCHCSYLALLGGSDDKEEILYNIYLHENRIKLLRQFDRTCMPNCLHFISSSESTLFVGSANGLIHSFDIELELWTALEGHKCSPCGITHHPKTNILLSWSATEVLLWSWPGYSLSRRLKVYSKSTVLLAGHIGEQQKVFAAFDSGTIMLWEMGQNPWKETAIEIPDGIDMEFHTFSMSLDNEWLVGGGAQPLLVCYSLLHQRVAQVIRFPQVEPSFLLNHIEFLPYIHPNFPKTLLLVTSGSVIVSDFINSTVIKCLRSKQYPIKCVCISANGFLLAVTYSNGTTKLYTLPSFFPDMQKELENSSSGATDEVDFKILQSSDVAKKHISRSTSKSAVANLLAASEWLQILDEFQEYPEKYRKHIWTSILQLPRNFSLYSNLLGRHEAKVHFPSLSLQYPNIKGSLQETLKNTLHCLCIWSPVLESISVLPSLILPFVEYFEENPLLGFEISVILIANWFRLWIDNWPRLPMQLLNVVEQLISDNDPDLWLHLKDIRVAPEYYILPLVYTSLSKVLPQKDWCILWDNILSKQPSFTLCIVTGYILSKRQALFHCHDIHKIKQVFTQEAWLSSKEVLKRANRIFSHLKMDSSIREDMDSITYIPKGDLIPLNISVGEISTEKHPTTTQESVILEIFPNLAISKAKSKSPNKERLQRTNMDFSTESCLLTSEERIRKGNECMKRVNNIRKLQAVRFT